MPEHEKPGVQPEQAPPTPGLEGPDFKGNSSPAGGRESFRKWGGAGLVVLAFLGLTLFTWRKWPDILIDFGRELYIPWQLASGKVLFRDLAYFNGPFSPYLNAWLFKGFGVSLTTLAVFNLTLLAGLTALIYRLTVKSCDRLTAVIVSLAFLMVFGFGHFHHLGNFNFVCPYSHELTHGLVLSFLIIFFLGKYHQRPRSWALLATGFFLGLVFLTKLEVFLAAAAMVILGMGLFHLLNHGGSWGKSLQGVTLILLGAAVPLTLFFGLLYAQMPPEKALPGLAGAWLPLFHSKVADTAFYRRGLGIDHPWPNFVNMTRAAGGIGLIVAGLALVAAAQEQKTGRWLKLAGAGVLLAAALLVKDPALPLLLAEKALPLAVLIILGAVILSCLRSRRDPAVTDRLVPLALLAVFALGLLAKMFLNASISFYGFALGMPAALLLIIGLIRMAPELCQKEEKSRQALRRLIIIVIVADLIFLGILNSYYYIRKDYPVGRNGDTMLTYPPAQDPRGAAVQQTLDFINANFPREANFLALPEGVMLNYLARRANPTPYVNFMPPEMEIFGETAILAALHNRPPDYILLIHKDTSNYGPRFFGKDYGRRVMNWVRSRYQPIWQVLAPPLEGEDFGIQVLKRTEKSSDAATGREGNGSDHQ